MRAPRLDGAHRPLSKHSVAWLAALAGCLGVTPAPAQTVVPPPPADSAARTADTARASDDTARLADTSRVADTSNTSRGGLAGDTARSPAGQPAAGTVPGSGSPEPPGGDTLQPDTAAARPARPAAASPPAPVDSVLAAACEATGGDPPDLLTVMFRATASEQERDAVAKAVGGALVGRSEHVEPGAWFLQAPNSAIDPTVADRVIRLAPVLQVGATRCPS